MNWKQLPFLTQSPGDLDRALRRFVSRRQLAKIRSGCQAAYSVEKVAAALGLNEERFLKTIAESLGLSARARLDPPGPELIRTTGFSAAQLRQWHVVPLPEENGYSLAFADPSLISIDEYRAAGVGLFLTLGSRVEQTWAQLDAINEKPADAEAGEETESSEPGASHPNESSLEECEPLDPEPEPSFPEAAVADLLRRLALECRSYGASEVRLFNGSRSSYEFASRSGNYSGSLHPAFLAAIRSFSDTNREKPFAFPPCDKGRLLFEKQPESHDAAEHCYRLWWEETPTRSAGRVLVIDDDERFSFLLGALLKNRQYDICTRRSAKGVVTELLSGSLVPDVIVCDVHMPEVDGGGFLSAIRSANIPIPALMLTSDEDIILEAEMVQLGASAFLRKREDPRVLLAWIESLLTRSQPANPQCTPN